MTLDEAIIHAEEVAKQKEQEAKEAHVLSGMDCMECASDHRQLAEWLRELKAYKKVRRILSQNRIATDRYGDVVLWDDIKRVLEEVNADDSKGTD
jgi:DNA mismatch repair ATPase MutS